jgi:hypothetical protein
MTRLSRFVLLAGTAFALPLAASAAPTALTLSGPINGNIIGPESVSNPCIIAGTTCPHQPASMGYNNFKTGGNITSFDAYSTTPTDNNLPDGVQGVPYTVGQLVSVLGSHTFTVAIDVNTASHLENLTLFEVYIGGTTAADVAYNYVGPTTIGTIFGNGNGWADYTLGDISLSGLPNSTTVLFRATWDNADDGAESFFLVDAPDPDPVPEPASLALLGVGLLGLGFVTAKRRN